MNDPLQNELLSAYLDGELNAAEQAEVERLLAADPSARLLLDELRALGVALQSLPQEKIGEDLSEAVLRSAARRVLLEGAPGEPQSKAAQSVPLGKSLLRRIFNVRGLVYTGIAVAFAVVIVVVERHQELLSGRDAREAALSQPRPARPAKDREGYPPAIQSARDSAAESLASSPPAAAAPRAEQKAEEAPSATGRLALKSAERGTAGFDSTASKLAGRAGSGPPHEAQPGSPAGPEMLVVLCDVTPEAVVNRDFEKLLAANGIVRRKQLYLGGWDFDGDARDGIDAAEYNNGIVRKSKENAETAPPPAGEEDLIYVVEAEPARIEAALAALAARPEAFSNVSMNQPRGGPARMLSAPRREEPARKSAVAGERLRERPDRAAGKAPEAPPSLQPGADSFGAPPPADTRGEASQTPRPYFAESEKTAKPGDDRANGPATESSPKGAADDKQSERQRAEPLRRADARQRVLFVLRNVGGSPPPVAAARIAAEKQAEPEKPREQQPPPPAEK